MRPYLFRLPEWLPGAIGGRPIFSYGVMLGISFICGWYLTVHYATKAGFDRQKTTTALLLAIVGSLLGARLLFFVSNPETSMTLRTFFAFQDGGLVAYGGYLGGIVFGYAFLKFAKVDFFSFADQAAPQLALGLGFTRVGCFLYGCDYGRPTSLPWGMRFPKWDYGEPMSQYGLNKGSAAFNHHVSKCVQHLNDLKKIGDFDFNPQNLTPEMLAQCQSVGQKIAGDKTFEHVSHIMTSSFAVHPTQIYASLFGFLLFAFLFWFREKKQTFDGQIILLFLMIYAGFRFFIEFIRDDLQRGHVGLLSTSQFISICLVAIAALLWWRLPRRLRQVSGA